MLSKSSAVTMLHLRESNAFWNALKNPLFSIVNIKLFHFSERKEKWDSLLSTAQRSLQLWEKLKKK